MNNSITFDRFTTVHFLDGLEKARQGINSAVRAIAQENATDSEEYVALVKIQDAIEGYLSRVHPAMLFEKV